MKLSKSLAIGIILLFVLVIGGYALFAGSGQSNFRSKSGFHGLKWGDTISEYKNSKPTSFVKDYMSEYFSLYFKTGENNFLGEVPLSSVLYSCVIDNKVEKLESVRLYASSREDHSKILETLTNQYGKYIDKKQSERGEFYIFADKYVTVHYWPIAGWMSRGAITISSKEMRSRYSKIYEKAEEEAKKKAAERAEQEAKRPKAREW